MAGRSVTVEECDRLWAAWTPSEVADRMSGVTAPWCVTAGWALDLFTGGSARAHADIEIAVPRERFADVVAALPGFDWEVAGDGRLFDYPEAADTHHQTWLRDPATGQYRLDVFREPHIGENWVCRRDTSITLPHRELILHTAERIPYVIPEVALLFKAKHLRAKDEADFRRVLPAMEAGRVRRLFDWLSRVHPGHPWLGRISDHCPR